MAENEQQAVAEPRSVLFQKCVWMFGSDTVAAENGGRKVAEIRRHDHRRAALDCRGKRVPVTGVR
jgi:hypothetical protein